MSRILKSVQLLWSKKVKTDMIMILLLINEANTYWVLVVC